MNIHEYQAKEILKRFNVRVGDGRLVLEGGNVEDHAENAFDHVAPGSIDVACSTTR